MGVRDSEREAGIWSAAVTLEGKQLSWRSQRQPGGAGAGQLHGEPGRPVPKVLGFRGSPTDVKEDSGGRGNAWARSVGRARPGEGAGPPSR